MVTQVLANSPAGPIEPVANLKRRQRRIYWRQVEGVWVQTLPLPSDPVSREAYLAKGFRLTCPEPISEQESPAENNREEVLCAEIARLRSENEALKSNQEIHRKPRAKVNSE